MPERVQNLGAHAWLVTFCSSFAQLGAGEDVLKLGFVNMSLRLFFFFFNSIPGSVYLQVILMVGLPGSGKTQWALKYAKENPEKRYNVLGAETVLNQMRVSWWEGIYHSGVRF